MIRNRILVAFAAGMTLLAGCATAAPVPAQTAPASVPPASDAPATSAAAPAGSDIDDFMAKVVAAQKGVKTYTLDMSMETVMAGQPAKIVMKGVVDQSDPANINMSMDMDFAGMQMKTLKVDGAMYLKMAATGKQWMKVPKDQMAQYESATDSADLTAGMEKAKGAMKKIDLVGDETIDGVAVHHYRITVDAAGLSEMTGSDAKISGDTFDYDVWLDDANLMRKVSMDVKADADGEDLPMTVNGVMGHFNEPVNIKAPDPKDVVEMGG